MKEPSVMPESSSLLALNWHPDMDSSWSTRTWFSLTNKEKYSLGSTLTSLKIMSKFSFPIRPKESFRWLEASSPISNYGLNAITHIYQNQKNLKNFCIVMIKVEERCHNNLSLDLLSEIFWEHERLQPNFILVILVSIDTLDPT